MACAPDAGRRQVRGARLAELPGWFTKTLTRDRGHELARHQRITDTTGINVRWPTRTPVAAPLG